MKSGDQNYREACSHYEKGDLSEAIELFTKAIDYYSKSLELNKETKAHYYRGCSYYRLGIQFEKNQMFEDSEENFEKAIKDFEEVSKKINELVLNKFKEDKDQLNTNIERFCEVYKEIDKNNKIKEKYNDVKENIEEVSTFKKNLTLFLEEFCKVYQKVEGNSKIKEKYDHVLEKVEELSLKIDDLFSFNYYAGCTFYKFGMLYEKKRMNSKAYENFRSASEHLDNASKCGLYKENGKLWFYKGIANYKLKKYEDSFEDFKKAVIYDYYDIEILEILRKLPCGEQAEDTPENEQKNILLLYYLKKYECINKISDNYLNLDLLNDLITKYKRDGAYYFALSRYEVKDFKSSFKIFDKLAKEEANNDLSSKKISSISWYYKGLILRELRNNYKDLEMLKNIINKDQTDKPENNKKFHKKFQAIIEENENEFLKSYKSMSYETKVKFAERLLKNILSNELNARILQKIFDIESQVAFKIALEEYNKLIESSQTFELYYDKALVLDELKRYKEAIESLDKFLKNKPRDAKAWLKKGTILFKIAIDEEIKTASEEPKTENKDEKSPCEKEITKINAAKNALEKSIGYFKILIYENPNNPDHWYNKGTAHSSLAEVLIKTRKYQDAIDEYEKAVTAFDTATTLNPNFPLAWNNKGNAYMKLKKYNKAIEAFEKAFEINPNYYLALHNKGDALYSLGKYKEAINIYDQVISTENDPNVYKSWNDRGLAKYRLENYEEALEAFDKAIDINPTFADGLINKGVVFYKLEIFSEARKAFEKALELEPGNSRASNNLGVVLAREGELNRAKKLFENTIQEDPDFILAHANLAELFLNSGGIEEASKNIKSIQIDDKNPDSNIGYIHFLEGRIKIEDIESQEKKYSNAAKLFEKAASFNLDNPIFLLWSVYAKYLCQKFEINGESDSSEESKSANENSQSKTEDIHSNELFNSIICDLEKVIPFCKKSEVTRDDLVKKINQDSRSKTILPICTIAALTITLILGIKILYPIFKFFGILELVRDHFYIALILLLLAILLNYQYRILKRLETKELKIEESMNEKKLTIKEKVSSYLIQLGIKVFRLESVSSRIRLTLIRLTLKSTENSEDSESETNNYGRLKCKTAIRAQLTKFNKYEKIEEYTLYLLGYFYFKLQDYTTAKEKLQKCISLKPDPRTDKAARDLLDNIWKQKIKPPFWTYWFNSPVNTWRRRTSGTFVILGILLTLFVHMENPQPVAWNNSTSNDAWYFVPDQINIYPYIISYSPANNTTSNPVASEISNGDAIESILTPASMDIYLHYPANNTTSNLIGSLSNNNNTNNENDSNNSNNNTTLNILTPASVNIYLYYLANNTTSNPAGSENSNNNTAFNILTPASVDIYPKIPDNYFDDILLLIFILILISPSVRIAEAITEAIKIVLKKGVGDVSLDLGPIVAPPEFNFELSPSLMLDVIKRLDENL
ncbi:tetratricopeptide repeat protein [Methanosarcina sp.]|jgi:tetratricopeptide (TPR) repeat protein|uniref:tetratricopeptide repeat protein n=1 Tax=Methanosarcina sp. TaxID=2213 RepID=UPI002BC45560|nr:tetratricopeptide repeat protein [Methanosarcina sp.]HOW13932.1 tetratricopeptide repeat protein [Methanosarcina sp.]